MIPVMKPWLGPEEAEAAAAAVTSGWVAQGPRVKEFENAFAARGGAVQGVAVSSCTTGLHLALHLLGLRPGDEVVVPSFSFIASTNAVRYVGAEPVFADVDATTGNLTPTTVEAVLTPRTRAVMAVHQAGVPADVEALRALCDPLGIEVVEDAACAAGSTYRGLPVGAQAPLAAWSFHPRKLVTTGEGGMLTLSGPAAAERAPRARLLREHGMSVSAAERHSSRQPVIEQYLEVGFNYRMTDIQAAVGMVQLGRLPVMVERRRELAAVYQEQLASIPGVRAVTDPSWGTTNYQSFWVELRAGEFALGRNDTLALLAERGVSARAGIMAAHRQPAYAGHPHVPLPVTERLTDNTLILPLFHTLTQDEQDQVVAAVTEASRGRVPARAR